MQAYLDNAATTKLDPVVLKKMLPYYSDKYGNPSSIHQLGQEAFSALEKARGKVAEIIKGEKRGIVFSSGATESNNLIIKGVARANKSESRNRIIISTIEHPCVREAAKSLTKEGFKIDYLPVNSKGQVELKELEKMIARDVILVSVMTVNNEMGAIQNIKELAKIAHAYGAYFHTDAAQAVPYLKLDVKKQGIDFLSLSAHKFYGPKGVGIAYLNPEIKVKALIVGGGQEGNKRSGTHNLPGIMGMSYALELAYKKREENVKKIKELRDYLWQEIKKAIPRAEINGTMSKRSPANLNVMFKHVEGEAILMDLSQKGISVSTGSACSASDLRSSYVLRAMGLSDHYLNSNIRFSLSKYNTKKEIDYTVKELVKTVSRLKEFSPIK